MSHVERLKARDYYNHPYKAPGEVVLVNGRVEFHGSAAEARKFEATILARRAAKKQDPRDQAT